MSEYKKIILLNQMAGPLFRQLCEGVVDFFPKGGELYTGHIDTLNLKDLIHPKLELIKTPIYNKLTLFSRIKSWLKYISFITPILFKSTKSDIFIITSNPPFLGVWVRLMCIIKPINYILLVYDIYPDILEKLNFIKSQGIISKFWHFANRYVFLRALKVVTISNSMAKRLRTNVNIDDFNISVIYPWVDSEFLKPLNRDKNPIALNFVSKEDFVILYSGNIGETHNIESMISVIEHLKYDRRFKFIFFGDGAKRHLVESYIKNSGNSNVKLYPFQDEKLLPYTLSLGDVSLVLVENGMEDLIIPSKLFSYLASGSAILGISDNESDLSDIIRRTNSGNTFKPNATIDIANYLIYLYTHPSKLNELKINSRKASETLFSQNKGVNDFINILKDLKIIC